MNRNRSHNPLVIRNISRNVKQSQIEELFCRYGRINEIKLSFDLSSDGDQIAVVHYEE